MRVFRDRHDAGAQLARALHGYADAVDVIVLAHSASSVPVAYEIATRLALPLDLIETVSARGSSPDLAASRDLGDRADVIDGVDVIDVRDKAVVLVDDGANARAMPPSIERLRSCGARAVIAAVALASPQVHAMLVAGADQTFCVLTPQHIYSIEAWYADLTEPTTREIRELLVAAVQNLLLSRHGNFPIDRVDS